MRIPFREVISGPELRTRFTDAEMMSRYLGAGSPAGEPIYLGFGETWTEISPGLAVSLAAPLPPHSHGYVISQYGLPRLQRVLRTYIAETHRIPRHLVAGRDFEIAVTSGGTRNAMFDFARLVLSDPAIGVVPGPDRVPVLVAPLPGWDYEGVVAGLGYRTRFLPLRDGAGGQPSPRDVDDVIGTVMADPTQKLALVVINAQHNPTGINWAPHTVRHIIRQSLDAGAAVLLDDAYYGVHEPGVTPTSALRLLLEQLEAASPAVHRRWLAVRSLGKQFHCSGWGLGAATAHPSTLDTMVNGMLFQRAFASAVPLQYAMASWLESPDAQSFLDGKNQEYADKRIAIGEMLQSVLGYPAHAYHLGECAAFLRIRIPGTSTTEVSGETFRQECLRRTGVLFGVDRWSVDRSAMDTPQHAWLRLYLGPPLGVILEALTRLAKAGYTYRDLQLNRE